MAFPEDLPQHREESQRVFADRAACGGDEERARGGASHRGQGTLSADLLATNQAISAALTDQKPGASLFMQVSQNKVRLMTSQVV